MTKSLAKVHPELFHYTNAKGLIGIIESQSMWATHYAYLNDSEEIRHFLKSRLPDLLRTVVNEYLDKFTQDESIQLRIDQQGDRKKIVDSFIQKIRNVNKKFLLEDALAEPYIASFCTTSGLEEKGVRKQVAQHGLLSQWRGYGNDGGYAIVFDTEQFVELLKDVGKKMESSMYPFLADVVYSSDPDSQFIKEFEEDLIVIKKFFFNHLSNIEDDENVSKFFYSLMHCACRYKHWGFKEENEVRVVALPYPLHHEEFDKDMKAEGITVSEISRKHFSRAGALVPYIDIFNGITSRADKKGITSRADKKTLPIKRIIVGPTQNTQEKNRRINAVKLLINQHGIKADVTASEIPFVG